MPARRASSSGPLDDQQRPGHHRQLQPFWIDRNAIDGGGEMRRGRRRQPIPLGQDSLRRKAGQTAYGLRIGFILEAGLHRLPVIAVERAGERG
jgi:hypothetical protein